MRFIIVTHFIITQSIFGDESDKRKFYKLSYRLALLMNYICSLFGVKLCISEFFSQIMQQKDMMAHMHSETRKIKVSLIVGIVGDQR